MLTQLPMRGSSVDVAVDVVARAISWVFDLSMLIVWLRGGAALNGAVRHSARTAARTRSLIQRLLCWLP